MKLHMTPKQLIRGFIYAIGIFLTGLGVNVLLRSALGAGAWDTVVYNLRSFFINILNINITLGTVSFIIYAIVLACVMMYNKKLKYIFIFIPIFGIALAIDFWDLVVLGSYYPVDIWLRVIFYLVGIFILSMGLALIIVTRYPAMVFDELTLLMMKLFKIKSFFITRIFIELFAIVMATILGFISHIGFGAVNFGSFVLALIIGPMIQIELKYLSKMTQSLFPHKEEVK